MSNHASIHSFDDQAPASLQTPWHQQARAEQWLVPLALDTHFLVCYSSTYCLLGASLLIYVSC